MTTIVQKEWIKGHSTRDNDKANGAIRVAKWSLKIAKKLNLFQDDMDILYQAALIHDLQYVSIFGYMIDLGEQAEIIKYKDEWYDGSGKEGLKRGAIPVLSRVLAIAAFYDECIYTEGLSKDQALDALQRLSGTRFDHTMIPVAIRALEGK